MCLTIPAKVLSVDRAAHGGAYVDITVEGARGVRELKALGLPGLKPGDWVLYTYDTVVRAISEDDAREIVELLEPKMDIDVPRLDVSFLETLKAASTAGLSRDGVIRLLRTQDPAELATLFAEANTVRQSHLKDFFCIHGIIEFSNHCVRDCHYCGLRKGAKDVARYRMTAAEITKTVRDAVNKRGYKLMVLQSGDDFHYTDDMLADIIRRIKKDCRVFIFMSVGERGLECYAKMKAAGASGALLRFETSDKDIYGSMHPGQSYEKRMELIKGIKGLGYYLATGFLIGLPGQSVESIADDILTAKSIGANMLSAGPFIPCESTPLSAHPGGGAMMALKVIAVSRLLMPRAKIPVTTALETIDNEDGRRLGLTSGANSLMFNLTPDKYRADYRIYPNKYHGATELWEKYGLFKEELSYRMLEDKMLESFEADE